MKLSMQHSLSHKTIMAAVLGKLVIMPLIGNIISIYLLHSFILNIPDGMGGGGGENFSFFNFFFFEDFFPFIFFFFFFFFFNIYYRNF